MRRLVVFIITVSFLVPPMGSPPAAGGSAWCTTGTSLHNGTSFNMSPSPGGIGLAVDQTFLNNWTRMDQWPSARDGAVMAYDSSDGLMILFGGYRQYTSEIFNETWTYNARNNTWMRKNPARSPPGLVYCPMVYDRKNGIAILFDSNKGNTWTYNLSSDNWTNMHPDPAPPAEGAVMAYDAANGLTVLFNLNHNQTWTYDGNFNAWTQKAPPQSPEPRWEPSMTYDSGTGCMVLFGGQNATEATNETWIYNLTADTWTRKYPSAAPSARLAHKAAYDSVNGVVVLFGGNWNAYNNDTWTYNSSLNTWTERAPVTAPTPRALQAMAFDDGVGNTILWGGFNNPIEMDDTWSYNFIANNWTRKNPAPPWLGNANMVFDQRNGVTVLYGGQDNAGEARNETWTYNLSTNNWMKKDPQKNPGIRVVYALAYDSADGLVVLFGGAGGNYMNDLWVYNVSKDNWTKKYPDPAPPTREATSMAYDSANDVIVLYGGCVGSNPDYNDTWIYNLKQDAWTEKHPAKSPSIGRYHNMVYDSAHGVMVLFGGAMESCAYFWNETWTYNVSTNTWTNMSPPNAPPGRENFGMAFDSTSGRVLIFGGYGFSWILNDTWAYDAGANTWTQLHPSVLPMARASHSMCYDSVNGAVVMNGGGGPGFMLDETWTFDLKRYIPSGNLSSTPFDSGGPAYFGNLTWQAVVPANTSLRFQLRTADSTAALNESAFTGPDGTDSSFYNSSGQRIASIHNGTRWMQYRAYLGTSDPAFTPILKNVTIRYNLQHSLNVTSPSGGETWNGTVNISWNASDPDGDGLYIDIHMLNGSNDTLLASNILSTDRNWSWDTSSTQNGTYRIKIFARDDNLTIPLTVDITSPDFTIFHPHINEGPAVALISPPDEADMNVSSVNLSWCGTDPEGDSLFFHVFLQNASFDAGDLPPVKANTTDNFCEAKDLDNGTYFWTVMALDGKLGSNIPPVRRFTIAITEPNHIPSIGLVSPADNATINVSSVVLSWNASDDENDSLTFTLEYSDSPFGSGTPAVVMLNGTYFQLSNLTDGITIYWRVTVSDGKDNASSDARHFTVLLPVPNHPPVITSSPVLNATVNETYYYNITASDPDNDTLVFAFVIDYPLGMDLNRSTGKIQWTPYQKGNFTVRVAVIDGWGGSDTQIFNITVTKKEIVVPPVVKLFCSISSLSPGQNVSKQLTVQGSANAENSTIAAVQVKIDSGNWTNATGKGNWSFILDTTTLKNGIHTISVRTHDGANYSDVKSVDVQVKNAAPSTGGSGGFPLWVVAVVIVVAAVGALTAVVARKKNVPTNKETTEAEDEKRTVAATAAAAAPAPVPAVPAMAATVSKTKKTSAPAPERIAPEGFAIDDIFLMYIDGRLILHTTRRIRADMDADIMASMLTAVQAFVKDSVGMESGTELGAMEYGNNKILLQKGKYVVLASVIEGAEPAEFRDEMRHTISNIEGEFGPALASWDGMATRLSGAKRFLGQLGAYKAAEAAVTEKAKTDISLKGELEFYQGFVRLKVAVKNNMDTVITKSTFKLMYNDKTLRLDHLEPDYERKGDEVVLGVIEPKEKKTVGFYLDPQICTESFLEGVLTYKDARGELETMKMPRKLASVVCPIMYSDENINTAMLKRMAAEELDKKDTKVFAVPPALAPETAFDLAEAAVQHHDVRLVREFTEKDPFVGEAWYFGKAKGRDDRIVIRARVLADKNVLEFFVASSSTLMLTGMLAELKADLNKELAAQRGAPEMRQVTAPQEVDAVAMVRTLLDKAAEAEREAGETEMKG